MHKRPLVLCNLISIVLLSPIISSSAFAQLPAKSGFEVASVKPSVTPIPGGTGMVYPVPGGRLVAQQALLRFVIQTAYDVRSYQLVGGPDWIRSTRYDIDAKAAGNPSAQQMLPMLQALLEERFNLKVHRETRELPIYTLALVSGSVKMPITKEGSCAVQPAGAPTIPVPPPPPGAPGSPRATSNLNAPANPVCAEPHAGLGPISEIDGRGSSMTGLTTILSNLLAAQ